MRNLATVRRVVDRVARDDGIGARVIGSALDGGAEDRMHVVALEVRAVGEQRGLVLEVVDDVGDVLVEQGLLGGAVPVAEKPEIQVYIVIR